MKTKPSPTAYADQLLPFDPVHVLLVDDNADDRVWIRRLFDHPQLHGSTVSEAGSAKEAREAFADRRPDCLLIDYHLPDQTGLELLQSLPDDPDGAAPETILMTVDENPQIIVLAMRRGVRDFLSKAQLNSDSLYQSFQRAKERRQLRLQLIKQRKQLEDQNRLLRSSQRALLNITEDLDREIRARRGQEQATEPRIP